MSVRIKNYEAASIYGVNLGIRERFDVTNAMLVDSLFLDFLLENGLKVKGESSRDVICVLFGYGSPSYEEEAKRCPEIAEAHKGMYRKISKGDLRVKYYEEGMSITYADGECIHYKMLYRTPGKAKKGTCMFIRDELYDKAHNFLYMGMASTNKIVEVGAYSSLITSSIVGRIKIEPDQILVLPDVEAGSVADVITVNTDASRHCYVKREAGYELKNNIFDGQALIDSSIFPEWGNGYILLRHHMTKCAAFSANIELFMRDHFGLEYDTAVVKDMWGRDVSVKNIKLITTESAFKWLKFDLSFDYWSEWVKANGCMFGIVKTAHESKLGNVQRMSYQMTNALNINDMEAVAARSVSYIEALKTDIDVFLEYLAKNVNFSNDYDVLLALVEHNPDFIYSSYFHDRRSTIINSYVMNFKSGHTIQNADNLTIVGSPYAMLMHAVGLNALDDPTFDVEEGAIQCYSERFEDGEYLAEFRSPFNCRSNLGCMHNRLHPLIKKYFNLGRLCVAVNMVGTNFQDKNNGSDQDSDSIYTTNQPEIVEHAKYCVKHYPTIVNKIPKDSKKYTYSMKDFAKVDNELAAAQLAIGESSNLAQLALTYTYNFDDPKYEEYACILSVLAQVAIDNAKRKFDIDLNSEIRRIKEDMNIDENGLPLFWQITKKDKRKAKNDEQRHERNKTNKKKILKKTNPNLVCPMNYLFEYKPGVMSKSQVVDIGEYIILHKVEKRGKSKKVEELIEKYSLELYDYNKRRFNDDDDYLLLREDFDKLISDIRQTYISGNYLWLMSWLLNRAFRISVGMKINSGKIDSKIEKNKVLLMKVLYTLSPKVFLECFVSEKNT